MPGLVPPIADERQGLLAYLAQQRALVHVSAYGLTEAQARATPGASALSIGGLVKHLAIMERSWMSMVLQREQAPTGDWASNFRLGPEETLAGALRHYHEVAAETEAIVAGIADLDQEVPVPQGPRWVPPGIEAWSVRWVLLHLIEETARHAGHADIVRESVDGATSAALMAAVEGWPPTGRVQPWTPATGGSPADRS